MMSNWNRLRVNLQARVSSLFYTHGLLVSSHPIFIITLVIGIVLFTCYPLTKLPLPGNAPQQFSTPVKDYESPSYVPPVNEDIKMPRWYLGPPVAYVQQLVFKGTVSPWQHGRLIISDAFRAPLHQVFDLIEQLNNFQYMENDNQTSGTTLTDICIHAPGLVNRPKLQGVLPEYGCMVLSPANFWGKDKNKFSADPEIINTIYKKYEKGLETQPTVRDLLFGLSMGDSAVNKYSFRNRQRIITYTVTIMVKKYDNKFISALKKKLLDLYPLSQKTNSSHIDYIVHIHDKEFNYFVEYTPLLLSYVVLFLYLYFSVRKIEMVKSKWGLALSAVCTVIASLVMSVGICALFGLTPSLSGSEIFPYLVIIVGLENVLVVTKSVVSTPVHLDVKLRVAKGISKEGWYIFKNLTTELAILTVGFFTFVPAIQEFCLFAVVGLLSDFFLQMFFYTTVLSIDIRRMELSDLHRQSVQRAIQEVSDEVGQQPVAQCPFQNNFNIAPEYHTQLARSQSAPRLNVAELQQQQHAPGYPSISGSDVGSSEAHTCNVTEDDQSIARTRSCNVPRRLQVFNFFAKAKLAQRGLMAFLIIWIVLVVYKTGLIEHFTDSNVTEKFLPSHPQPQSATLERLMGRDYVPNQADPSISEDRALLGGDPSLSEDGIFPVEGISEVDDLAGQALVQHKVLESWRSLSHLHWNTLLGHYNQSVRNRYISILPSIHLSMLISPEHAVNIRHPDEQQHSTSEDGLSHLNTHFTSDMLNAHHGQTEKIIQTPQHLNLTTIIHRLTTYPQSGSDWIWLVVFAIATVILLFYLMINLYRCLCSRNYARWRRNALKGGSRMGRGKNVKTHRRTGSGYYKQIRESMPLILNGHTQVIECLITDGPLIISSCLGGHIFVWDSMNGERISTIQRQCAAPLSPRTPAPGRNINDSEADLYAEFHEDTLSDAVYKGHRGSLSPSGSIGTLNSSIEARGSTDSHLHRRPHSADYSNLAPDLSNTIMTDFIDMGKDNIINTNTGNSSGHSSATSGSSGNIEDSSKLNTGGESVELPDSDGGPMVIGSRSVSESDSGGYDFSRFDSLYEEHESDMCELRSLNMKRAEMARQASDEGVGSKDRTFSCGSTAESICSVGSDGSNTATCTSPIWCLTSRDNLIITGCGDGRIEMWDAFTGLLRCVYHISKVGVVGLCFIRNKVIAARLNGYLDFLELETFANINREPTTHRTAFTRTDSSSQLDSMRCWPEVIHCTLLSSTRAHQQAITVVKAEAGRVVTGSQDHTLKVFRLEDLFCLYTLHGHKGSITTLFLDSIAPLSAASGSNDGSVRLWDLLTGACVHKFEGHGQGHSVTSLLCTDSYVISSGTDDRLYVWERCKGNLLHWLQMNPGFCRSMAMLTSHLMVSGGQGCLYMWDISKGKILRAVPLGDHGDSVYVNDICVIDHTTVICDYGHQLRVIHFPSVLEKSD